MVFSVGCDDEFEEINTNPNSVTEIDDEFLFANAALQSLRGNNNTMLQFPFATQYAHVYVGQNNAMFIDRYYDYFTTAEYKELFHRFYYGPIRNIQEVRRVTQVGGERENEVRNAMARVIAFVNFAQVADAFGSVPYSDGGLGQEGKLYPKYDSVEFIYKDMLEQLKQVVTVLSSANASKAYPGADPVFENDLNKWLRFANSLRLRFAMRIRFADPSFANGIITECMAAPLIENNKQNVVNENEDTDVSEFQNPFFGHYDYWQWKMSELFVETLKTMGDPRLEVFVKPNQNGEYIGIPNGLSDSSIPNWTWSNISDPSDNLVGRAAPIYYMSAAEIWLLRAEAALFGITNEDANELYQTGIRMALEQWNVAEDKISAYLADAPYSTLTGSTEEKFRQICTHLWYAVMPNAMEGWTNIRRTGYPIIHKRFAPEFDEGVTNGRLPTRCKYPSSEVNINNENYQAAIDEQGADEITTKLWWDVRN